jgi:chemotaxis protein methyltransferase CheR
MTDLEFNIWKEWVKVNLGLLLEDEKKYLVEHRLKPIALHFKLQNLTELHQEVAKNRNSMIKEAVITSITTHETSWFRDSKPFELFKTEIFPEWIKELREGKRNSIRIWSAACSTGQEPYSIAMILAELCFSDPNLLSKIQILATDVSENTVLEAQSGVFSDFAIQRGIDETLRKRWFTKEEHGWEISHKLKQMIHFKTTNLAHPIYLNNKQDLILCRNVLIYFTPDVRLKILNDMERWLNPNGIFMLGASENSEGIPSKLEKRRFSTIQYFLKK